MDETKVTCGWGGSQPCGKRKRKYGPYCTEHAEVARRNVLRCLGLSARQSLMWRDGDEVWLFPARPTEADNG